jgi:hypothetical protein
MNMLDIRRYEMLVRVKGFGVAHTDLFPTASVGAGLFEEVATAVDRVTQYGAVQSHPTVASDPSSTKTTTRDALRASILRIRHTASAMVSSTLMLDGKFVVPRSHSDRRLLLAARAFLDDATPLRDQFVAHHLSVTFLDDLAAQIDAFERAIQANVDRKAARAAARVGIAEAIDVGVSAADRLDAIVANVLEQKPETLAEWHSARHVSQVSVPRSDRKPPAEPAPAPAPEPKAA